MALERGMKGFGKAVSELGSHSWHLQGHVSRGEQAMTGYKRVSVWLNYVFLVPLLQPWVFFSIPSVNILVSQDCSLDQE